MQISFFFVLLLIVNTLEDEIRFFRLFEYDHIDNLSIHHCDCLGERVFADLALEFGEVNSQNNIAILFFDFTVNPVLQAGDMDKFTRPLTKARTNQRILFCRVLRKANFTTSFQRPFYHIVPSIKLQLRSMPIRLSTLIIPDFQDNIFDPPKPDNRTWHKLISLYTITGVVSDHNVAVLRDLGMLLQKCLICEDPAHRWRLNFEGVAIAIDYHAADVEALYGHLAKVFIVYYLSGEF